MTENKKISELDSLASPSLEDVLPIVDVSENQTKSITLQSIKDRIGDVGIQGERGPQGQAAIITNANATIDDTEGTPEVEIINGGTPSLREFIFNFKHLKGPQGEPGAGVCICIVSSETQSTSTTGNWTSTHCSTFPASNGWAFIYAKPISWYSAGCGGPIQSCLGSICIGCYTYNYSCTPQNIPTISTTTTVGYAGNSCRYTKVDFYFLKTN